MPIDYPVALRSDRPGPALEALRPILVARARAVLTHAVPEQADALAEDCAQEALLKVLSRLDDHRGGAFEAWAGRIAEYQARSELRRSSITRRSDLPLTRLSGADPGADDEVEARDRLDALRQAAQLLPSGQAEMLGALLAQEPFVLTTARLGISHNALYKRVHDLRRALQRMLGPAALSA